MKVLKINKDRISELKNTLQDNIDIEYIYHIYFNKLTLDYNDWRPSNPVWKFPDCWLTRYHLYFDHCRHWLQKANILDIGSNLNFYSTWAILNGASKVDYIEPDLYRYNIGKKYLSLNNMTDSVQGDCININQFMNKNAHDNYDVIFLLDVFYYITNQIDLLNFIKNTIKPKVIFFETTVINDIDEYPDGIFKLWQPSTQSDDFQSYSAADNINPLGMCPSRKSLYTMFNNVGFIIDSFYDYKDYTGPGESSPRLSGKKVFMTLIPKY